MNKQTAFVVTLIVLLFTAEACSPTRKLKEGERLLVKNKLIDEDKKPKGPALETEDYVLQKPNKKLLGIWRFNLWVYNLVNQEKMRRNQARKDSLTEIKNEARLAKGKPEKELKPVFGARLLKFGEPPAIYDSSLANMSDRNMEQYLFNKSYFHAHVRDSTSFRGKKKVIKYYFITYGPSHTYRNVSMIIDDPRLKSAMEKEGIFKDTPLKTGQPFDLDQIDEERMRITKALRKQGYFFFNNQYVEFAADTGLPENKIDISLRIRDPQISMRRGDDTVVISKHIPCKIRHVYVEPEYRPGVDQKYSVADTFYLDRNPYIILHNGSLKYTPRILTKQIIIESGNYYNTDDNDITYQNFSSLRNFKYINIDFTYVETKGDVGYLDCYIKLSPSKRQSFSASFQGTTTGAYPGLEASFSYQNKNAFFSAEQLEFRLFGRAESQIINDTTFQNIRRVFNTLEFGGEFSVKFPKFLVPFNIGRYSKRNNPLTTLRLPITYQTRPDYARFLSNISFGYEWNETPQKRHRFNPVEFTIVRVQLSDHFRKTLQQSQDRFLLNSFTNHIISSTSYTYLYSNYKANNTPGNYVTLKAGFEYGGNILYGLAKAGKWKQDSTGRYLIAYIPFAQFVKTEFDFRDYWVMSRRNTLAFRAVLGVGVPYGNSNVMPFEKSFSAAGANDLRGFIARRLGPGSHYSGGLFDQFGDIKLLLTLEHRFKLTDQIELGLYADAGNIWLMRKDLDREFGEFRFDRFYREIAISAGLGLRLNLGFFIFRLDPAFGVYNPASVNNFDPNTTEKDRDPWRIKYLRFRDIRWNFAIGYPF